MALDELELAQLLLQLVPQCQQDQYKLIKGTIPMSMRLTLDTLEQIKKIDNQVPRKAKKVAESGDGRKGKRKVDSKDDKILLRGNAPPGIVPSVLSMVVPN